MKNKEIWKNIEDSGKHLHAVSNLGRIKRLPCLIKGRNTKELHRKLAQHPSGYFCIALLDNAEVRSYTNHYVHRLVAQAFLPNPNNLPQVNHKDHNKQNNELSNLEWCSNKDNIADAARFGRLSNRHKVTTLRRATDEIVATLYEAVFTHKCSINEASAKYGIPRTTISSIMNKRSRCGVTDLVDYKLNGNQKQYSPLKCKTIHRKKAA